ncbi:MAG: pseudouridine synthase [Segetibacter sp.]
MQKQQPVGIAAKATRPNKYPKSEGTAPVEKTVKPNKYPKKDAEVTVAKKDNEKATTEQMPLNKYIAHGGICSRRDAAILVKEGKVTVNGTTAIDPGTKVSQNDVVKIGNKKVTPSKNFVYILLNKPKDYITTSEDPQGRKIVLDLVRSATDERVYPVGRLDRNTSGVLLLTNDGELAQKLSHPSNEVKKVYEVKLDRSLTKGDMDLIASGITLVDGFVAPDVIAYADAKDKSVIGVEIHSGRNRIVRRIFEHLKYDVKGLDRVMFAGLTKKMFSAADGVF